MYMTPSEALLVFAWVYVLPFVVWGALLLALSKRHARFSWWRFAQAAGLMAVLAIPLALGLAMVLPYGWLFQHQPVMWAPFVSVALALVLPLGLRWVHR